MAQMQLVLISVGDVRRLAPTAREIAGQANYQGVLMRLNSAQQLCPHWQSGAEKGAGFGNIVPAAEDNDVIYSGQWHPGHGVAQGELLRNLTSLPPNFTTSFPA